MNSKEVILKAELKTPKWFGNENSNSAVVAANTKEAAREKFKMWLENDKEEIQQVDLRLENIVPGWLYLWEELTEEQATGLQGGFEWCVATKRIMENNYPVWVLNTK